MIMMMRGRGWDWFLPLDADFFGGAGGGVEFEDMTHFILYENLMISG